ncbi:MAG TPA: Uma2 family endonuclease [Isosphaeraceae bacterium]|jgi:Uma2 family endonuclease|nr:Uma2 family endonuclease [Isosphaeraceae bacterium]
MATIPQEQAGRSTGGRWFRLEQVGWAGYLGMLEILDGRRSPRLIYLDGDLTLMSPTSIEHERLSDRLSDSVKVIIEVFQIPCYATREATYKRRGLDAGIQGDVTFYLHENVARIRGKKRIDLRTDPPPDLAIEAVVTHRATEAVRTWRRLHVPEIWVADAAGLGFLVRGPRGRYSTSETSRAFPFLSAAELFDQIKLHLDSDDQIWLAGFRQWVQAMLAPRRAGG